MWTSAPTTAFDALNHEPLTLSGCRPVKIIVPPSTPIWAAGALSGIARASAAMTVSTTVGIGRLHPDIGAGNFAIMSCPRE